MTMTDIDEKKILLNLKDSLAKKGIISSWGDPLFHRAAYDSDTGLLVAGSRLNISFPLTVRGVPVDRVTAFVNVERESLFFSLSFYFNNVMDEAVKAHEIEAIWDLHDSKWFPQLADYFRDIQETYGLKWDIEHNDCIIDTLYGLFPLSDPERLLSLMRDVYFSGNNWNLNRRDLN